MIRRGSSLGLIAAAMAGVQMVPIVDPPAKLLLEPEPKPKRHTGAREAARRLRQIAARTTEGPAK